jgi:hypothetical protein
MEEELLRLKNQNNAVVVLPVGGTEIVETQAFVYFAPDDPMDIDPVMLSGDEADWRAAIQALAPLLSDADRTKYRDIIEPKMPKTLRRRLQAWRERNGKG